MVWDFCSCSISSERHEGAHHTRETASGSVEDGSIVGSVEGMKALGDLCINSVLVEHVIIN